MKTFIRICKKDLKKGDIQLLESGKKYITSEPDKDGAITVFTRYWFALPPDEYFEAEKTEFTPH